MKFCFQRLPWLLLPVIVLSCMASRSVKGNETDEDERPNILLISIDDFNDWIGCVGGRPGSLTVRRTERQCRAPFQADGVPLRNVNTKFISRLFPGIICAEDRSMIKSSLNIRHYAGGSVVSSFHGAVRSTKDVDIACELKGDEVAPIEHYSLSESIGEFLSD